MREKIRKINPAIVILCFIFVGVTILALIAAIIMRPSEKMQQAPERIEKTIHICACHCKAPNFEKIEEIKAQQEDEPQATILELPLELESHIDAAAARYNLDADLVRGVIWTESRGVVDADNGLCYGLMQINTKYADVFCEGAGVQNITDPKNNILAGCWWLAEVLEWADGDEILALMAYNMGQTGAWKRWEAGTRSTTYSDTVLAAKEKF